MLTRIAGGRLVDPVSRREGIGDLWIAGDRIVAAPANAVPDREIDAAGCIVMAGAIDVHSHIAGGNVTLARLLLPELRAGEEAAAPDLPFGTARWSTFETGRLYARMGYTTVIEPALVPTAALATHLELEDIPLIDRGGLAVVGNDDQLLSLLRGRESPAAIRDYVALTLANARGLGLKVINAGGAAAFKENVRRFGLDDTVPSYGLTSRAILTALLDAAEAIGVPHPLHVHANNLGLPGAADTLLETFAAAEGRRIHLAHAQFYSYDRHEAGGFSSAAERVSAALADHPNVTLDVGQVVFGQTCTISLDILRQYAGHKSGRPRKWILVDGDAEGGGIVPYRYNRGNGVNALQFAIGLELFLRAPDPWRVLLTTDHPNGGPFTAYPRLIQLLMDKEERDRVLAGLPAMARERSGLASIEREYTLREVAIMTRAAPARLLGLADRGHLGPGARADIALYEDQPDRAAMFAAAKLVLKDGEIILRDGEPLGWRAGRTLTLQPPVDPAMARRADAYLADRFGTGLAGFAVPQAAFADRAVFEVEPCRT
ncbi:formylmethanofuran dehydrogenase subunit A [Labrys wisconsinensis]|uniref:Formylmethanofuran dehydrogenase subunit A n=1 Tax=Labrys wisconsinensis TaxID=425677 RepID=A0ABU0J0G1_9HYPH|nr:formylmethanofuran dehydrogenase subunit A [Labrys wisconsinensis]MDQ0467100.1 formylmethanofuran dehydrogenase subunit A [Labrys wisconsinensis]